MGILADTLIFRIALTYLSMQLLRNTIDEGIAKTHGRYFYRTPPPAFKIKVIPK